MLGWYLRLSALAIAVILLAIFSSALLAQAPGGPPPPVTVAQPLQKQITEWDEFTGRFEAVSHVEVRARVSGVLQSIHFRDGELVKEGALLYVIDQRPFEIALKQAKAQVAQAQAQLDLASSDVDRARPLMKSRTITGREFEARETTARGALASLEIARAAVAEAELNLEWTQVRAPIAGRVSDSGIDVGNLISGGQSGATLLTRIVSLDPIHFVFEGSEADYLKYNRLANSGKRPSSRNTQNPVAVKLIDEDEFKHEGKMDFVDNTIDLNSGTIRARAILDNPGLLLTPGLFGRLRLFGGRSIALLIPDAAITSDQARKVVMTVTDEGKVVPKVVKLGPIVFGLRVIRSGLSASDRVVIDGLQRARPGQKVTAEPGKIDVANIAAP